MMKVRIELEGVVAVEIETDDYNTVSTVCGQALAAVQAIQRSKHVTVEVPTAFKEQLMDIDKPRATTDALTGL